MLALAEPASFESGTLQLEVNSAAGIAGGPIGWDLLAVQGGAALNGTMLAELLSLTQANDAGENFDFDPLQDYQWTFLTAGSGITGFDPNQILIDTSGFSNSFGGQFFVSQVGNSLALNYVIPEPSSCALAALGMVGWLAGHEPQAQEVGEIVDRPEGAKERPGLATHAGRRTTRIVKERNAGAHRCAPAFFSTLFKRSVSLALIEPGLVFELVNSWSLLGHRVSLSDTRLTSRSTHWPVRQVTTASAAAKPGTTFAR